MKEIHKIIVPVDLSVNSQKTVDFAIFMANKLGAELSFFHCVDFVEHDSMAEMAAQRFSIDEYTSSKIMEAENIIDGFLLSSPTQCEKYRVDVVVDDIVQGILTYAESEKAEMIIIGTHGKQIQGKILLGSVAGQVLRVASCPVLVINPY